MNKQTRPNFKRPTPNNGGNPLINSTKQGFEAFFNSGISLQRLEEGSYPATLVSAEYVTPTTEGSNPYVKMEVRLLHDNRIIVDNRFEKGFGIFVDHIKEQLGIQHESIMIPDLIAGLKETQFNVWIEYVTYEDKQYRNVHYKEPVQKAVVSEEDIPQY